VDLQACQEAFVAALVLFQHLVHMGCGGLQPLLMSTMHGIAIYIPKVPLAA